MNFGAGSPAKLAVTFAAGRDAGSRCGRSAARFSIIPMHGKIQHRPTPLRKRHSGLSMLRAPLCAAALLLPLAIAANADVIYLKNGQRIVATSVRRDKTTTYYSLGGGEVAISNDLIDHIQTSKEPPSQSAQAPAKSRKPIALPPPAMATGADSALPVVRDGAVDEAYLSKLDQALEEGATPENQHRLAMGYQQAAVFLLQHGDADGAIQKYRHALDQVPGELSLEVGLGYMLIKQGDPWQAINLLLPAADQHPNSPDIPMLLGSAYYSEEDLAQTTVEWQKALALHDNPELRKALERVRREQNVTGAYQELRSEHFLLRYDGNSVEELANQMLPQMEDIYQRIETDLNIYPQEPITVLLYTSQAYRDITRSPDWSGAVNDGKIRLPVSGLTSVTPDLLRVLKHEITHSFVHAQTMDRCPVWFNEGLAQMEEGATAASLPQALLARLSADSAPRLKNLQGSFMHMQTDEARLAYAKSLLAVEYLRQTYGMGQIRSLLQDMPKQPNFEALLESDLNLDYSALERNLQASLQKQ